jgi:hypothetical protein
VLTSWNDWPLGIVVAWMFMSVFFGVLFHRTVEGLMDWIDSKLSSRRKKGP